MKIKLSEANAFYPPGFASLVDQFIAAKKEHLTTTGQPAPAAPHPLIEAAVRRVVAPVERLVDHKGRDIGPSPNTQPDDFVADYEIEDDTPPPVVLTVAQKKDVLAAKVNADAAALAEQVMPRLKQRLFMFQHGDAIAVPEANRTPEQVATIAAHTDWQNKLQAINRYVAEVESQIHDLPDDMVDVWKAPPFPA